MQHAVYVYVYKDIYTPIYLCKSIHILRTHMHTHTHTHQVFDWLYSDWTLPSYFVTCAMLRCSQEKTGPAFVCKGVPEGPERRVPEHQGWRQGSLSLHVFSTLAPSDFFLRFHHSQELLEGVFNAALADRTQEGDRFIPPNPNTSYIVKLRNLVNEELFCERGGI